MMVATGLQAPRLHFYHFYTLFTSLNGLRLASDQLGLKEYVIM